MQTRNKQFWIMLALLSGSAAGVLADDAADQAPTAESLQQVATRYQNDLNAGDTNTRLAALDALWPTSKDVVVLFPDHADKLNRFLELVKEGTKRQIKNIPTEALSRVRQRGKVQSIQTINVRSEDSPRRHRQVLTMIPKDVPVYRIVTEFEQGIAGSSSYIYVNGHWVQFQDFSSVPELLPKLDEALVRISKKLSNDEHQDSTPTGSAEKEVPAATESNRQSGAISDEQISKLFDRAIALHAAIKQGDLSREKATARLRSDLQKLLESSLDQLQAEHALRRNLAAKLEVEKAAHEEQERNARTELLTLIEAHKIALVELEAAQKQINDLKANNDAPSGDANKTLVDPNKPGDDDRPPAGANDVQPKISAFVIQVGAARDKLYVEISAGSDDGVRNGREFDIFRGKDRLGSLVIVRTTHDRAVGQVNRETLSGEIRKRDRVSTRRD